jgi:hypothetical protein
MSINEHHHYACDGKQGLDQYTHPCLRRHDRRQNGPFEDGNRQKVRRMQADAGSL